MTHIRTHLILCFLLLATLASAQGFFRSYLPNASLAHDLLETPDSGFFLVGRNSLDTSLFLLRTDAQGQTLWTKHFQLQQAEAIATCLAPDGGLVVLAKNYLGTPSDRQNVVFKLSPDGDTVLWQHVFDYGYNGLHDIATLPDGSFMAVGSRALNQVAKNWLVKISETGALLWEKYPGANYHDLRKLAVLPSGNVVLAGSTGDFSLAKVSTEGALIWEYNYPHPQVQTFFDMLPTPDGGVAILGTTQNLSLAALDICVLKTDGDGNELWLNAHYPFALSQGGSTLQPVFNCFEQDSAGNFYIPLWGFDSDPLASDLELLKLAPDGNPLWKHPLNASGTPWAMVRTADNHFAIAGENNGDPAFNATLLKTDFEGEYESNKISGSVFRDEDVDCIPGAGEAGLANFIVKAENAAGEVFYKRTNADGTFEMYVSEGEFALTAGPSIAPVLLYAQCDTPSVTVISGQTVAAPPIAEQVLGECPLLTVEISGGLLRRCTTSVYSVSWCNAGNLTAEDATLQIVAHPFLNYQSSTMPLAAQSGDTLTFALGDLPPGACDGAYIVFLVDCDAEVNDVLCAEAHIFPDSSCAPPGVNWDGSKIEVTGICTGSEIEFKIKNTGAGNMTEVAEYVIIEDQIMYMQAPIQLNAGQETTTVRIPMPEDSCFALQVFPNQSSILSKPVAVVANCAANGNLSLLLNLPNNENDPAVAVHCNAVIGSFDPNDKTGFPMGLTDKHFIEREQDIEYRIRFQNTGNDTAFLVRILDTLATTLDPASVRVIAASHPYTWDLSDAGILTFSFANILLPDSTTNEPASHGFVSFRISQKPNLADGTFLENTAAIYFDFNEPVLTNTWRHTIGRPEIVSTKTPGGSSPRITVQVLPHPVGVSAHFSLQGHLPAAPLRFALFSSLGTLVREEVFAASEFDFKRGNLPSGLYFWQITDGLSILAQNRLVLD